MTVIPLPCTPGSRCRAYAPGHRIHAIHAGLLERSSSGWHDAVVRSIDDSNRAELNFVASDESCVVWHHHDLSIMCSPGSSVQVHQQWHAVAIGGVVVNVHMAGGVGLGAAPSNAGTTPGQAILAELATGQGRVG